MIIIMESGATEAQINKVVKHLEENDFKININYGEVFTVIAAIGDKRLVQPHSINSFDGVREVKLIQEPFKLASRESKKEDTIIEFSNGVKIGGGNKPVIMAGPCSVEEDFGALLKIAEAVKSTGAEILRGGAFKPRTSPYDFQGMEEKGLKYLRGAADKTGLLVITEVMDTLDLPLICDYADIIQVGARNMQNFKLLKAIGKTQKPVMLKRGPAAGIKEFLLAAEHILYNGNENVILCERGIKGFDSNYTRNVLDLAAVPVIKKLSHLPVIVDPSHATGKRYLIEPMSKAAVVSGADGLMVEVHNNPDKAYSDGAQSLTIPQFTNLMAHLSVLINVLEESRDLMVV